MRFLGDGGRLGHLGGGEAHQGVAVGRGDVDVLAAFEVFLDGEADPLRGHLRAAAEDAGDAVVGGDANRQPAQRLQLTIGQDGRIGLRLPREVDPDGAA